MSDSTMDAMRAFCTGYVPAGLEMAGLARWFLWAALAAGLVAMVLETIAKAREALAANAADGAPAPRTLTPLKEVFEALKGLVEALAKAPIWLALFAVGIVAFWVPGSAVSGACGSEGIENSMANAGMANEAAPAGEVAETNRNGKAE